jgi:hypothetical protein
MDLIKLSIPPAFIRDHGMKVVVSVNYLVPFSERPARPLP